MKKFVIAMVVIILLGAVLIGVGCAVYFSSDWRWGTESVEYYEKTDKFEESFSTLDLYLKNPHKISFVRGDKCEVKYFDTDIAPIAVSVQGGTLTISEKSFDAINWFKRIFYKFKTTDIVITVPESCSILDVKGTLAGATEIKLPSFEGTLEYGKIDLRVSGASTFVADKIKADNIKFDVSGASNMTFNDIQATSMSLDSSGASKVVMSGKVDSLRTQASGSVNMRCDSFECPTIDLRSSGSSEIYLSGTGSVLNVHVSGSGKIWARDFTLDRADIDASGSTNAELTVSTYLKVDTSGSSHISYWGDPEVEKHTSGTSTIVKKG
ncbi:MAG: DUF2807 domain-containing protein [Clostridia bacterium]|nr:DUF2807 domain-containing protein [Clostridia bacterium]